MLNNAVCKRLLDESYKTERELQIHSLFNHSINLIDKNDRLITILDKTKTMMPYSIMLPTLPKVFDKEKIILFNGSIVLNEQEEIKLQNFEIYDGSIENLCLEINWERIEKRFKELALFLKKQGSREGMLPFVMNEKLNQFNRMIYDDYVAWWNSYKTKVIFDVQTHSLIGFGAGLTPSFDDLLCGLMLSDIYYYKASGRDIHKIMNDYHEILLGARARTNLISYHMLQMAAEGLSSKAVKKLLKSFYSDENNFEKLMNEVKNFGHSSGTDILCGIYCSIKNKIERSDKHVSKFKRNHG